MFAFNPLFILHAYNMPCKCTSGCYVYRAKRAWIRDLYSEQQRFCNFSRVYFRVYMPARVVHFFSALHHRRPPITSCSLVCFIRKHAARSGKITRVPKQKHPGIETKKKKLPRMYFSLSVAREVSARGVTGATLTRSTYIHTRDGVTV